MSSTDRSNLAKDPTEFFETPPWATRAILPYLPFAPGTIVLDPFAGRGAILNVVRHQRGDSTSCRRILGLEIDRGRAESTAFPAGVRDSFSGKSWFDGEDGKVIVITNPPYSRAQEAVERGLREIGSMGTLAMLLRLDFMASAGRAALHRSHPADIHVLPRRPSFAISLKCGKKTGGGCGWSHLFAPGDRLPVRCPTCRRDKLLKVTTDSNDYGWWVWGPGRGGRWSILDVEAA